MKFEKSAFPSGTIKTHGVREITIEPRRSDVAERLPAVSLNPKFSPIAPYDVEGLEQQISLGFLRQFFLKSNVCMLDIMLIGELGIFLVRIRDTGSCFYIFL